MIDVALATAIATAVGFAAHWRYAAPGRRRRAAEADLAGRGYRMPDAGSVQRAFVVARHARIPWRSQADLDRGVAWLEREGENERVLSEILRRQ